MANFFADNDDLAWYFDHGIDWQPPISTVEARAMAENSGKRWIIMQWRASAKRQTNRPQKRWQTVADAQRLAYVDSSAGASTRSRPRASPTAPHHLP